MRTKTLIIDNRRELSTKYRKILEDKTNQVEIIKDIPIALKYIQANEPDIIIISDSINEDYCKLCEKIRILTYNMRPIIVAMSKSAESSDKIKVLECSSPTLTTRMLGNREKSRVLRSFPLHTRAGRRGRAAGDAGAHPEVQPAAHSPTESPL